MLKIERETADGETMRREWIRSLRVLLFVCMGAGAGGFAPAHAGGYVHFGYGGYAGSHGYGHGYGYHHGYGYRHRYGYYPGYSYGYRPYGYGYTNPYVAYPYARAPNYPPRYGATPPSSSPQAPSAPPAAQPANPPARASSAGISLTELPYDRSYCREFTDILVIGGQPQTVTGLACRQADGAWRIVPR